MNILFDYSIFFHQKYGGVSRYFINLHNEFLKKNINTKIIAPIHNNIFLKNYVKASSGNNYLKDYPRFTRKLLKTYNQLFSNLYCKLHKPDIIHKTFYEKNIDNDSKIKKILTVYDLIHEIYYNEYNLEKDLKPKEIALKNIDKIICPSKKTKKDLINFYNISENKIEVVYMGIHKFDKIRDENLTKIDSPFILYVGDRKRYKNFSNLIKAYSISSKLQSDFKLICCGGGKLTDSERSNISKLKIDIAKIIQIDGSDNQLHYLYKNASAFIFPSKYEGFGLPQLEAMSLGCPVISSNHQAIIEAVGNAAALFNPEEPEDIKFKMEEVLYSPILINELKKLGIERSKLFSWEKCANETLNIYKKLLNN
tara:strand:+ start:1488 stop:2588 length:1101 start_codon:yes stop_codon:yes gene_type:complete